MTQLANPYTCPPGWTPDPNVPCACLPPPQIDPLKAAGSCDKNATVKGDPCDVSNGNVYETEPDYLGAGTNPLRFIRRYNSLAARNSSFNPATTGNFRGAQQIGVGWMATYFQRLFISAYTTSAAPSLVYALRPSGQLLKFRLTNGVLLPDSDISDVLTVTANGFQYKTADNTIETYNSNGLLLTVAAHGQPVVTVTLDVSGLYPSAVADPFGHSLQFEYFVNSSGNKLLQKVKDPATNAVIYGYDGQDNLTSVQYQNNTTRIYGYTNYTVPLLTQITDEASIAFANWTYQPDGNRVASSSNAGNVNNYTYSGSGTSTTVIDPLGTTRNYGQQLISGVYRNTGSNQLCPGCGEDKSRTFDANGNVISRIDFNDNLTCYAYDLTRNLETVRVEGFAPGSTCPAPLASYTPAPNTRQRKIATTWHSTFRLPDIITEPNRTIDLDYYANGDVFTRTITDTTVVPNVSRTWTYTYDSYGRVLTEDEPRTDVSDITTYTYYTCTTGYQCGQVQTVTNTLNQTTTYNTYNAHGQPLTITDPNGVATTLAYDERQRLLTRTVGAETTTFEYWPTSLLKKVTLPDTSYLLYTYDNAHRLFKIEDGQGNRIQYTLDAMGNRTAENTYDPSSVLSRTRTRIFNSLNQLWKDIGAAGTAAVTTQIAYDNNGNQTAINAPLSRNTVNAYDELNRLKQITDPALGNTYFGYDGNDNLTSVQDPKGLTTSYAYTGFGELKTQASPDTASTTNTYDSGGNLKTSTDARNAITTYTYDVLNRVTSAAFKIGTTTDQTITYTYDTGTNGKGRLTGASDASHSMSWTYDAQGRVTGKGQTVGAVTKSVGYGYSNGNQTSLVMPSGQMILYGYTNGQVTSISVNGTSLLSGVLYEPFGPIRQWSWGNGTLAARTYDQDGRVSQIDSKEFYTFAYDDASHITGITNTANANLSWTYGYDSLDRLTSAVSPPETSGWSYDANGNRLTQTGLTPSTFTIDAASNRLNTIAGYANRTYSYSAAGNATGHSNIVFAYNNRGRMKTATVSGTTFTYVYNALGQLARKSGTGIVTTLFVYDEAGHLLGEYDGSGTLIQETVWLGDTPVATLRPATSGVDIYYVHADQLNTPRKVTRPSDNKLRWRWDPDAFGNGGAKTNPQSLGTFIYNLRFPGQIFLSETSLHYNYFRDYDPRAGRYVESDPAGLRGGLNTYAYVQNNPIELIDPKGLESVGTSYGYSWLEWLQDIQDVSHPCLVAAAAARRSAFNEAEASGFRGPSSGPQDAFRHCVGSCKLATLAGAGCAKTIGDNHEAANLASGQPLEDSEMDWNNNAAGRDEAKCRPGKPCKQKCRERLQNCQLFGRGGKHLCYPPR